MIHISIHRTESQHIAAFHVSGHAEYDVPGKDIVCAGVSAVTVGTVNAIDALLHVPLESKMEHGLLEVRLPALDDVSVHDQVQLLLESMVVMLRSIEESYGKYIELKNIQVKRR